MEEEATGGIPPSTSRGDDAREPGQGRFATRGAGTALLAIGSRVLALLTTVVLARIMGAQGFGIYTAALAIVSLAAVFTGLGFPTLVVRMLPAYRVREEWALLRGLVQRSSQVVLGVSALGAVTLFALAAFTHLLAGGLWTAFLALAILPLAVLTTVRAASVRGLHRVVLGQIPEALVLSGTFLAAVLVWWLTAAPHATLAPSMALTLRLLATALALLSASVFLHRSVPRSARAAPPAYDERGWMRSSRPLLLINGLGVISTRSDVIMLALLKSSAAAGVYQAATRGAELAALSLVIVNLATQPMMARLFAEGEMRRLQRLVTLAARLALAGALPVALALSLGGRGMLAAVFGKEFGQAAVALSILAAAQIVSAAMGSVGQILTMTGHEREAALGSGIAAASNVLLNLLLIPPLGVTGAAIATGLSIVAWNVVLALHVFRTVAIRPSAFARSVDRLA